jgi:mannose-6-phosphate isomerase-like protein (cupin superfamily)
MAKPGDVMEIPILGIRIEFRTTTAESIGELLEFDLVGRPRGFITAAHVHPHQDEWHEVVEGRLRMKAGALETMLGPGERYDTPAGTAHAHMAAGEGEVRVRVGLRPARQTEAWLERLCAMDRAGEFNRAGWPRPVPGARLISDFPGEAHAAGPPPHVQQRLAETVLRVHAQLTGAR